MTSFLVLYRGRTIGEAKVVALTIDARIVAEFARRLLERTERASGDSVLGELDEGRVKALRSLANLPA